MITITIDNAGATPAHELRAVAQCLINIADTASQPKNPIAELKDRLRYGPNDEYAIGAYETLDELIAIAKSPSKVAPDLADVKQSIDAQIKAFDAPLPTIIAAADLPDVGAPTIEPAPQGESLREPAAIDPRVVFGAALGNVPAVPVSNTVGASPLPSVPAGPQVTSTTTASVPKPPVPPVPGAAAQTDEGVASDAQFDKTGLPWDARIHSRGRSMNSDGTWRSKRGVDDATVAAVSAELRAVPGVPVAPASTLADDVAIAEANWPFKEHGAVVPPPPPVVSFPAFMGKYVPLVTAGKISQAQITEILVSHGIPSLPLLSARTDLLPTIAAQLDTIIGGAA